MRLLASALLATALLLLLPAASGTCQLNEGTNISEVSLCGEDWVEIIFPGVCE
jgi:hypothetical protein